MRMGACRVAYSTSGQMTEAWYELVTGFLTDYYRTNGELGSDCLKSNTHISSVNLQVLISTASNTYN